jgi:creatinine amidohydrolase
MREVRWERMFPDELERAFAEKPVIYFTYGLCEPHGPQNAVGLDELKAHGIACRTAHQHGGIVAPADFWHIHEIGGYGSWGHHAVGDVERPWMSAVPPWHHFKSVLYHVRQAEALGFHAAIFLTGHYGPNWEDLVTMLEIVQPHVGTRIYGLPDWMANEPGYDGASGDHAGKVETSLLWAIDAECVDVSRIPEGVPDPPLAMPDDARLADRRIGERMVEDEVRWLGAKAEELLGDFDKLNPEHTMRTFGDTERVWAEYVRPRLKDFRSMQQEWEGQASVPDSSHWSANMVIPPEEYTG